MEKTCRQFWKRQAVMEKSGSSSGKNEQLRKKQAVMEKT